MNGSQQSIKRDICTTEAEVNTGTRTDMAPQQKRRPNANANANGAGAGAAILPADPNRLPSHHNDLDLN